MAEIPDISTIITNFSGGISQNSKSGPENAARFTRNLDIFRDMDSVTVKPAPVKVSGSTVTDLVKWGADGQPWDTNRYFLGDAGNIYKETSGGVWSVFHTMASGVNGTGIVSMTPAGQGLAVYNNSLYATSDVSIGRYFPLSNGNPLANYADDYFEENVGGNVDQKTSTGAQTYTPPTSISETSTAKATFTPAHDPCAAIAVYVTTKGTGNWTITLHDSLNNVLGTSTIANGSLSVGALNVFRFSTPVRLTIGTSYHFHVTSTVADGTAQTGTASDFSTAYYQTYFSLVPDSNYHPLTVHTNGVYPTLLIGNGNYIGQWIEGSNTYNPNQISLEPAYTVRAFTKINEYVVALAWRGTTIDGYEYGKAYFWDGIAPYYNFSRDLTQGMPNAATTFKNRIFGIFGSNGSLEIAPDESSPFRLIQTAPKLTQGSNVEVLPGAIGVWQGRALFGYSNTNDSNAGAYNDSSSGAHSQGDTYTPPTGMEQGIYEFGNQSDRAITYTAVSTEVLNFAYSPSTAIANPTSFKIGLVYPAGKYCYFSYKDGSTYYVDKVTKSNNPVGTASWESLIDDRVIGHLGQMEQQPLKPKLGIKLTITFPALPTGCTVTAKYRQDRASAWTFGNTATATATSASVLIANLTGMRYKEMEWGFDITHSGSTFPTITAASFQWRPLNEEREGSAI